MKKTTFGIIVLIVLILGCKDKLAQNLSHSKTTLDQRTDCPGDIAVFGDARFQTEVFRGSFSSDGQTLYFFKKVTTRTEDYRIFQSEKVDGNWSTPRQIILGGDYSDLYPSISKDGTRLVFSSYRPVPKAYEDPEAYKNAHLWYSDKVRDGWGEPIFMAKANKVGYYHSWVEFGWDNKVFFRRVTPDWSARTTYFTTWDGKSYTVPKVFSEVEQWKGWSADVLVVGGSPGPSTNQVFLNVETHNPETDERGSDIWVSVKKDNTWGDPRPLSKEVNQEGYDLFPFFSPDGNCLYFVRDFDRFYVMPLSKAMPSDSELKP